MLSIFTSSSRVLYTCVIKCCHTVTSICATLHSLLNSSLHFSLHREEHITINLLTQLPVISTKTDTHPTVILVNGDFKRSSL